MLNMHFGYQLLEKSRLCINANSTGTNFNVLYSLAFGAPDSMKEKLELTNSKFAVSFLS